MKEKEEKRICTLERQIAKIKQDIDTIGDVRRGSLSIMRMARTIITWILSFRLQ